MIKAISMSTHSQASERSPILVSGKRRPRVLLGEQRWALRDLLVWAFEDAGYDVVAVANGPDLLHVLSASLLSSDKHAPFDLIVADVSMPGWLGLGAVEKLAINPRVPPIVITTPLANHELRRRATRAGILVVMDKPFALGELTAIADRVLAGRTTSVAANDLTDPGVGPDEQASLPLAAG